jgi:hypothetical protein
MSRKKNTNWKRTVKKQAGREEMHAENRRGLLRELFPEALPAPPSAPDPWRGNRNQPSRRTGARPYLRLRHVPRQGLTFRPAQTKTSAGEAGATLVPHP